MSIGRWSEVIKYINELFIPIRSCPWNSALSTSNEAGFPPIRFTPNQESFLAILVQSIKGFRKILEIRPVGRFTAHLAWPAPLAPGGKADLIGNRPQHIQVAREIWNEPAWIEQLNALGLLWKPSPNYFRRAPGLSTGFH